MANQYSDMGIMQREQYVDNLDAAIEVLWMRKDSVPANLKQFFHQTSADSETYKISSVSDIVQLPRINEDTADLPYVTPAPGYDKTFTMVPYRSAIRVTDTMLRTDRFGKIVSMAGGLMNSAMRKLEYLRASIFNNAFSGTAGADSLPLCEDTHPHEDPTAGTWDNESTGALTGANLQALRLLSQKIKNEIGAPMDITPMKLVVPTDLEQKALELTGSAKRAEDALNADTVLIKGLEVVVSKYLSSTTAYFLMCNLSDFNKGMLEVNLMNPEMSNNSPADAQIKIDKQVKFMTEIGFTVSKNIFGSAGT